MSFQMLFNHKFDNDANYSVLIISITALHARPTRSSDEILYC